MKVNLARALTVDGTQYFAGEQFVDDAVAEKLRGQDGVTFPDDGSAPAEAFNFAGNAVGSKAKKAKAELLKHMGVAPAGAKTSHTSVDKSRQPAKES